MAANVGVTTSTGWHCSVGDVLLDVRYGKHGAYRLDVMAHGERGVSTRPASLRPDTGGGKAGASKPAERLD